MLPPAKEAILDNCFGAATSITLGDGNKASFWTESCLPDGVTITSRAPKLFSFIKLSKLTVAAALLNNNWVKDIKGHGIPDTIKWKFTADGVYSSASAYKMFFLGNSTSLWAKSL
ncbi:hypothetical protein E2562_017464 [Oryza meyeriana var. granulata]|uniref:Reverse transcriptase zinc-binding domain-containing protein n=1 Tax=Oryza meyeriana var. granulata TaxID=110450 RepID=A0A6G1DXF6_9ORYZ|nr:hypothetical protein E2562_017464 [Oryza meyeriana var. granulata]